MANPAFLVFEYKEYYIPSYITAKIYYVYFYEQCQGSEKSIKAGRICQLFVWWDMRVRPEAPDAPRWAMKPAYLSAQNRDGRLINPKKFIENSLHKFVNKTASVHADGLP